MTSRSLILLGDYYGSLAAARQLGRAGVEIHFADPRRFTPGPHSNQVTRALRCPPVGLNNTFMNWLEDFGQKHPGCFLYPVSDDLCWILSRHKERYAKHFTLLQPGVEAIYTLLNKQRLSVVAAREGVPMPQTWYPESDEALDAIIPSLSFPVLIKPRSQIGFLTKTKGKIVSSAAELKEEYPRFRAANRYHGDVTSYDPSILWPMIQEYLPGALSETYSVAGFISPSGKSTFRAGQKVFQRPRKLGIGVGFEARAVLPEFAQYVQKICAAVNYYGIFEVEFVHAGGGRYLMTDFNPRYYGQMSFEIARAMPLPLMAWTAARGDQAAVDRLIAESEAIASTPLATQSRYAHSWIMRLLLRTQRFSGRMPRAEHRQWKEWLTSRDTPCFDALKDPFDRWPYRIDTLGTCLQYLRHPRDFVRKFFLDE